LRKIPPGSAANTEGNNCHKKVILSMFFIGTNLLALDVLLHQQKFNQNHFLGMIAPELSKRNPNAKRRVGKNQLVVHIDNSMCHNGRRIREYFARKTIVRVPHPVYSPGLSPCDFWFFGYARERMKD
jgi:hypothetical protein